MKYTFYNIDLLVPTQHITLDTWSARTAKKKFVQGWFVMTY